MTRLGLTVFLAALALGASACGGEKGEEEGERGTVACTGSAVANPGLPQDFPQVSGVTFTRSKQAGPSRVVDGYYEGDLDDAYEGYKSGFEDAGYDVLFSEKEEDDAEVSWRGGGRTGQVALRKQCKEEDRLTVHVTSRPGG